MKILWHANAPWAFTGYGQQTALTAPRLKAAGHKVAISAFYGLAGSTLDWDGIRIYPAGHHPYGNDILTAHAENWFGGLDLGLIITLIDAWVLDPVSLARAHVACWTPVDHYPVPPRVTDFFKQSGAVPIAMSKFGASALREQGLDPLYVPHAIDTKVFAPRDRTEARKALDWPESAFIVGMVAANKGYPARKGFPQAIEAFGRFYREHTDSMLYLHAEPAGVMAGVNIPAMLAHNKIPTEAVRFADPYFCSILGFTNDHMANAYSAMDVFLNPSLGEGFGIPVMEAQACGTPAIVTDWTAMPEVGYVGWHVAGEKLWTDQQSYMKVPYIDAIYAALDRAYTMAPRLREKAREHALGYDVDLVMNEHWKPTLEKVRRRLGLDGRPAELPVPSEIREMVTA